MKKIVLLGTGGHAKSVVDTIIAEGKYEIAGFIDKENKEFDYLGYKIIGCDEDLPSIYNAGIHYACICIGFLGKGSIRQGLYTRLKKIGFEFPDIVDPTAALAKNVRIEEGVFIGKGAVVNSNAEIGRMAIVNTAAVIEHDCLIGDFTHVAVGSVICGAVKVGKGVFVGANTTVIQGIHIGAGAIIGAGSIIVKDVEEGFKAFDEKTSILKLINKNRGGGAALLRQQNSCLLFLPLREEC